MKKNLVRGLKEHFLDNLEKNLKESREFKIRNGFKEPGIFLPNYNGLIDIPFQKFMISKGYDGMIYREGGEG